MWPRRQEPAPVEHVVATAGRRIGRSRVHAHACQTVDRGLGFGHVTVGPMSAHELMWLRRSRPTKRPINEHPLSASPLNDANLMAGLHAGDRVDTKPTEQGGGVESL